MVPGEEVCEPNPPLSLGTAPGGTLTPPAFCTSVFQSKEVSSVGLLLVTLETAHRFPSGRQSTQCCLWQVGRMPVSPSSP